jgi:hypothetical protein
MQLSMPLPESADQLRACGHKSERLRSGFTSAMPSDSTGKADFAGGPSSVSPMSGQGVTTMSRSLSLTRCGSLRHPFPPRATLLDLLLSFDLHQCCGSP